MKKIINKRLYDTDTAEFVHSWTNGCASGDFKYRGKDLYCTKKGSWFIHHYGGAMTDMCVERQSNTYSGSEDIEPISQETALRFLESHGGEDVLIERFSNEIEEA